MKINPQQKWKAERGTSTEEGMISGRYETNGNQLKVKHYRAEKVRERSI